MTFFFKTSLLLGGAMLLLSGCSEEQPEAKAPRPIKSVVAQVRPLGETVTQIGEVKPRYETPLSFRINGQLLTRVENGTAVKSGDILASIDKTPSRNNLLTAQADLATAQSGYDLAQTTADRNRELFAKNIIPRAQMQEADANLQSARARVDSARAALANAQETLSYTDLKAPRDGIISAVGANEGQVVAAGQMVVTLISDRERDAVFDIPEKLMNARLEAPPVEVRLISDPAVIASGKVREVTPSADPVTRTFRVKVALDDQGNNMQFGAAVVGTITLSPKPLVQLPASALTSNKGNPAVLVYDSATHKLAYKAVTVERFDERDLFISNGLANGDIVATAGVSKLRDGVEVRLESEGK
ncbi:efflux RND transporter periplasmic adaptor subunit [Rhizobium oryziradicis]|uniref:Efflux transporter periplasmic adaptor subunit n=1 Tax=Rhizobium oryziradicis TaxID=1867956 RepID=A0A1Q8ZWS8_9HYPH|nr:efflux RND transporter periplasmic adaptor subunit [Rhizobium oryziradicis]OLP46358.1 efflux transporter periplasmic adaptor subunit [Rhizobium oryziradicis]